MKSIINFLLHSRFLSSLFRDVTIVLSHKGDFGVQGVVIIGALCHSSILMDGRLTPMWVILYRCINGHIPQ